jgi:NADH-quinone oxidoreductase subunit L
MGLSTVVAVLGVGLAFVMYGLPSVLPDRLATSLGALTRLSQNKFYFDEVYQHGIVLPMRAFAQICRVADWLLIDGLLVGGISRIPALLGRLPRPIQNGLVQFYALAMVLAMAVLLTVLLVR